MHPLAKLDHQFVWHPFTQMRDWLKREPIVIVEGQGSVLRDAHGREYLDANSSIWTNLHGHGNRSIGAAITAQLKKIAHSSALGFANEPASQLAARLVAVAPGNASPKAGHGGSGLQKVFFSDDGSTAMEVALKLAYEHARRSGLSARPRFLSLGGAYHGDTVGAVSLGHIDLFHKAYSGLLFKSDQVPAPYCYRCPYNKARPERADAREYRKCNWECVGALERKFSRRKKTGKAYAGFVFEPLMQGAAGMIAQPREWLRRATGVARSHGALLIADEVMTGFGRTGQPVLEGGGPSGLQGRGRPAPRLFACEAEGVAPGFLAVAKGLTGGYLPMAATLTTMEVFNSFLGEYSEFKTFFHGHSFTGNQLGAAASLASLDLLATRANAKHRQVLEGIIARELKSLWQLPWVGDIRQVGLLAGIELVRDWRTRQPFALEERAGIRVCERMAKLGVLTRPIGNVLSLIPPYCSTEEQVVQMVAAMRDGIRILARSLP